MEFSIKKSLLFTIICFSSVELVSQIVCLVVCLYILISLKNWKIVFFWNFGGAFLTLLWGSETRTKILYTCCMEAAFGIFSACFVYCYFFMFLNYEIMCSVLGTTMKVSALEKLFRRISLSTEGNFWIFF